MEAPWKPLLFCIINANVNQEEHIRNISYCKKGLVDRYKQNTQALEERSFYHRM